jgi:DNA-binding LacI/PurR family transcriptional regulator
LTATNLNIAEPADNLSLMLKRVTITDVAKAAGVSRFAVSHVLFGTATGNIRVAKTTAERIRRLSQRMGYVPNAAARRLKGIRSRMIAILFLPEPYEYHMSLLWAAERFAEARGFRFLLGQLLDSDVVRVASQEPVSPDQAKQHNEALLQDLTERGIDGLLLIAPGVAMKSRGFFETRGQGQPIVVIGPAPVASPVSRVEADFARGTQLATEHLIRQGRRRIALILPDLDYASSHNRRAGFVAAHAAAARPFDERQICVSSILLRVAQSAAPSYDQAAVNDFVDELFRDVRPDAILANNDSGATLLLAALRRKGVRVPEDVAVIGHDNDRIARLGGLTTIDMQPQQIAETAVTLLMDQIQAGQPQSITRVVPAQLILRDSA